MSEDWAWEAWECLSQRFQWVDAALARRLSEFPQRHKRMRPKHDWYKWNWAALVEMATNTLPKWL